MEESGLWLIYSGIPVSIEIYHGHSGSWYFLRCEHFNENMDHMFDSHFVSLCGMTVNQYVKARGIHIINSYQGAGCPIIRKSDLGLLAQMMLEDDLVLNQDGVERKLLGIQK